MIGPIGINGHAAFRHNQPARVMTSANQVLEHTLSPAATSFPMTLMVWHKPLATATNPIISIDNGTNTTFVDVLQHSGGLFRYRDQGATLAFVNSIAYTVNTWCHLALVQRAANDRQIYINGAPSTSNSTNVASHNLSRMRFGQGPIGSPNGHFAEGGFWQTALSSDEIKAIYNGLPPWEMRPEFIIGQPLFSNSVDFPIRRKWIITGTHALISPPPRVRNRWQPANFGPLVPAVAGGGGTGLLQGLFGNGLIEGS